MGSEINYSTPPRRKPINPIPWKRCCALSTEPIPTLKIDDTPEREALVPDRFRAVQWTTLPGGVVPPAVRARLLKLWSHRAGVLKHEAAALDYANAIALLVRARANLDLAKQRLEDATVTAPVVGTVIEKDVSQGMVITSATGAFGGGTTLIKMADLGRVRMRAQFNETDIGQIRAGQVATVIVDAYPDRRFTRTLCNVQNRSTLETRNYCGGLDKGLRTRWSGN